MGRVTLFDQDMNFVLLCMEFGEVRGGQIQLQLSERRGALSDVDMQSYKPNRPGWRRGAAPPLLLDSLVIYASSPQDYFEIMTTCASLKNQPQYVNGTPSPEPWLSWFKGKSAFFRSIREKRGYSDSRNIRVTVAGGVDFTLADVCLAFNPGSLALFSLPAYLVMDSKSGFYPAPGQSIPIGRWTYDLHAPGGKSISSFDDYYRAFLRGDFLKNNSDVFLTTYALANAIAALADEIRNSEFLPTVTSFRDCLDYEPLLYVLERLVERGALDDPFEDAPVWKTCDTGIVNAQEANPDLAATLRLTDALAPITTGTVLPGTILQVFYGLVDVLPLREYFSIDRRVQFEYPALDDSDQYGSAVLDEDFGEEIPF